MTVHTTYTTLITAEQLMEMQRLAVPFRVFDCTHDLMNPAAGEQQFVAGHIPGAQFMRMDDDLSQHTADQAQASGGRHPLPSRERFAETLRRMGLDHGMQVVVYDRQGAQNCGRLWWMLRWCGHEAVAVLDGGLPAWLAAGGAIETGTASTAGASPGTFTPQSPAAQTLGATHVARQLGSDALTVIDARAAARFRGEVEPLDPVAGHIPGALNRPFTDNFQPDGRFKPADQLRQEFEALLAGRDPAGVVHHCGSGITAIPNLLAMELAGMGRTSLFPGSWSEWCTTPGLPCARG